MKMLLILFDMGDRGAGLVLMTRLRANLVPRAFILRQTLGTLFN